MKALRIIVATVLTIGMLGYARLNNASRSVHLVQEKEGIRIDHITVGRHVGQTKPVIKARIEGALKARLFYKSSLDDEYTQVPMIRFPDDPTLYSASLPVLPKGWEVFYYMEATGAKDNSTVVTLPGGGFDIKPVLLRYVGHVPIPIVIGHVLAVFAAVFFAFISLLSAIDVERGKADIARAIKYPVIAVICMAVGFFMLGFPMNMYAYGTMWEGIPFGSDVTDNKSQLIFIFWFAVLALFKGSVFGRGEDKNFLRSSAYFTIILVAFLVMLIVYAIPHSI